MMSWYSIAILTHLALLISHHSTALDLEIGNVNSTRVMSDQNAENDIELRMPDWSVFSLTGDVPNIHMSKDIVRSIPVQYYWDSHKGQFKFGILGESVEEVYPQFVTSAQRKFSIDSPIYNVTSANTDEIFPHLVLVIQHLAANVAAEIEATVQELLAEGDNFALKIIRIANETGIEWRTASEIRTSREVIEIKKQIVDAEIQRSITRDSYRNETFHFYNEQKMELLETQHQNILHAIIASHQRQDDVEANKQKDLLRLAESTENKRRETQISILHHAHNASIERLAVEVELGIKAIRFRASEEGRAERENEDVELNIMRAKGESLRKGFEEIVSLIHIKSQMIAQDAINDPALVFKYVFIISAVLSLYIILVEASQAVRSYMESKVSTPAVLRQVKSQRAHEEKKATQQILVMSSENSRRLDSVSDIYAIAQRSRIHRDWSAPPLLLPNVLIVGPPGTGKTMSAEKLAEASDFPFVVVCGGDLLAASGKAAFGSDSVNFSAPGRYLRDVLHGAKDGNRGRGFIVILDEVETIITDRGKRKDKLDQLVINNKKDIGNSHNVQLESRECLHILLTMLRQNSVSLGVIITTSLKLEFIDPALLDRMDRVMSLDLPDPSLRLNHILQHSKSLLSMYMETAARNLLNDLCLCDNYNIVDFNRVTFEEEIKKVVGDEIDVMPLLEDEHVKPTQAKDDQKKKRGSKNAATTSSKSIDDSKKSGETDGDSHPSPSISFNLLFCVFQTVMISDGWSYRELSKVIQSIQSSVIATEECIISTELWMKQVNFKAAAKKM